MTVRKHAIGVAFAAFLLLAAGASLAAESGWRKLRSDSDAGKVCLAVQGQEFEYTILKDDKPAVVQLRGPRRLKIVTRYLFGESDPSPQSYTLRVIMDGREILRRAYHSGTLESVSLCGQDGDVSALRKSSLRIPTGKHELQIFAETAGGGRVAARFYRESKTRQAKDIAFAPEQFDGLYHLQFASGKQSSYYHFSEGEPLAFSVKGPTTLKIYSRLDFDHTMNGSQNYSLEVLRDGESVGVFHYHAKKLSGAAYVERPEILPGARKLLRVTVPRGVHNFEMRCLRPEACGIAVKIQIPEADVTSR